MNRPGGEFHESFARDDEIAGGSDRAFGFIVGGVLALVGLWPLARGRDARWWAVTLATAILALALTRPGLLRPLNRLWTRLGLLLHGCVQPVVMGLVFFTTVTPIALVMRLLGKDPLRLRFDSAAPTYWIERRPPGPAPDTMRRQF